MLQPSTQTITPEDFTRLMIEAIKRHAPAVELERAEEPLVLRAGEARVFLHNSLGRYTAADPRERRALLAELAANHVSALTAPKLIDPARWREQVLPFVRDRTFAELDLGATARGPLPRVQLGEHLVAGVLIDLPTAVAFPFQDDMAQWGVGLSEALNVARDRLRAMTPRGLASIGPGSHISSYGDNHDSARLLLTDLFVSLALKGDPVALVPGRDALMVTGSDDAPAFESLLTMAEKIWQQPYAISLRPLVLREGVWEDWSPPPGHPAHRLVRRAVQLQLGREYASQQHHWQASDSPPHGDVFIGGYTLAQNPQTGELTSYCVWGRGMVALLPRTDAVFFMDAPGAVPLGPVPWDEVMRAAGHRLKPRGVYPERYFIDSYPSAQELRELRPG